MELISSIGTLIAGTATAIAGHFVRHDLYEAAPRHVKRLLDQAVRILPENDRERYLPLAAVRNQIAREHTACCQMLVRIPIMVLKMIFSPNPFKLLVIHLAYSP